MDNLSKLLIKNIKKKLSDIDRNQSWLSKTSGIPSATISRWTTEDREPGINSLIPLSKALGCTPADLITDSDSLEKSSLTSDLAGELMLSTKLIQLRNKAGLTQLELAEKANVGHRTIQDIEHGVSGSTVKTLLKLSKALNVSPSELIQDLSKSDETNQDLIFSEDTALKLLDEIKDQVISLEKKIATTNIDNPIKHEIISLVSAMDDKQASDILETIKLRAKVRENRAFRKEKFVDKKN